MKNVYTTLGFALGASAATLTARDQCCFSLTATGGKSGVVGQVSYNRLLSGYRLQWSPSQSLEDELTPFKSLAMVRTELAKLPDSPMDREPTASTTVVSLMEMAVAAS